MTRNAVERLGLRLLQRGLGPLLLRDLSLGLRDRDDGLRAHGLRRRRALDAERGGARHARRDGRRERRCDRDGLCAPVSGDVGEHPLEGLFGGRRAGPVRALDFGRGHARAEVGRAGRARDDARGDVGRGDFARFEGRHAARGGAVGGGGAGGGGAAVRAGAGAAEGERVGGVGGAAGGRDGAEGAGREGASSVGGGGGGGKVRGEVRGREGRRGDEERRDLDFGRLDVRRAQDRVLLRGDAVERAQRVWRDVPRDLGVGVAHDRVPHFDGSTALEDIYPYRAAGGRD